MKPQDRARFRLVVRDDPSERRGIWVFDDVDDKGKHTVVEIRAGREGDDAHVVLRAGQTLMPRDLYDLVDALERGRAPEILTYDKVPGLPPIEAEDATNDQLVDWFDEDIFQYVRDDGSIVDVGWYPSGRRDGSFRCVLVAKADPEAWAKPVEEFRTKRVSEAREWVLARTIAQAGGSK